MCATGIGRSSPFLMCATGMPPFSFRCFYTRVKIQNGTVAQNQVKAPQVVDLDDRTAADLVVIRKPADIGARLHRSDR